jgi:hypothetical protein
VHLFDDSEKQQDAESQPDTSIQFFGDDRQQTATSDRLEDQFVNVDDDEAVHALVYQEVAAGSGTDLTSDSEHRTGFHLIFTYGASVRQSKTIPLMSSSWNELIRIPIREGIRFQGQGKVNIKLVKRINHAEESIGECKLEVSRLLPHKTDFSVLSISNSVQLSLQTAFVPQRVQVRIDYASLSSQISLNLLADCNHAQTKRRTPRKNQEKFPSCDFKNESQQPGPQACISTCCFENRYWTM